MNRDADTADPQVSGLALTGERTLPGVWHENYWFRRHEAAYDAFTPFVTGARVVDLGCGEGYGAQVLAGHAREVLGIELDPAVARHVRRTYGLPVARGDLQHLGLADGSCDVVANLQTVEHLWDQPGFITECTRILRPAGTLLITTPNTLTFPPGNPFHTRELDLAGLVELLAPRFQVMRSWGLRHGRRILGWERRHGPLIEKLIARPWQEWTQDVCDIVRTTRAADFTVGPATAQDLDLVVVAVRR